MSGKLIVLLIIAICATVFVSLGVTRSHAAECTNYNDTVAALEQKGATLFFIAPARLPKVVKDAEALTGQTIAGTPTRGFIIWGGDITVLGLEVNGCLNDPIYIHVPKPAKGVEPGKTKDGVGA